MIINNTHTKTSLKFIVTALTSIKNTIKL